MLWTALIAISLGQEPSETGSSTEVLLRSRSEAQINQEWAGSAVEVVVRQRLYRSSSVWTGRNGFELGGTARLSSFAFRGGAVARLQPVAPLQLFVAMEGLAPWGPLRTYAAADADVGVAGETSEDRVRISGWQMSTGAQLQFRYGPVGFMSRSTAYHSGLATPLDTPSYYDPEVDLLVKGTGWWVTQEAQIVALLGQGRLGATYHAAVALHPDEVQRGDQHRLGGIVAWTFPDPRDGALQQPILFVQSEWYVKHPARTGLYRAQALPMIRLGFAFSHRLWASG